MRERRLPVVEQRLYRQLVQFAHNLEQLQLGEYLDMLSHPRRMLAVNFMAGLARGLGMAVGFTVLGALVIYILRWVVLLNLPGISSFIAEIVKMVMNRSLP
ncbi:MAG: hypothetical protein D9V47_13040 [Clostridia bacterium]|nr:MAG: hypothetical protein D9V47_13040 [Clostridia bacterium]